MAKIPCLLDPLIIMKEIIDKYGEAALVRMLNSTVEIQANYERRGREVGCPPRLTTGLFLSMAQDSLMDLFEEAPRHPIYGCAPV